MSYNQNVARCRKCGDRISRNQIQVKKCVNCKGLICSGCLRYSKCFKCKEVHCIGCMREVLHDSFYRMICYRCKE